MTPPTEPTNTIKELNLRDLCVWPAHIAVDTRNIEALRTILKEDLLFTDSDGETALHYAAINVENKTAYDWACEYNQDYGSHIEICEFLKKYQ